MYFLLNPHSYFQGLTEEHRIQLLEMANEEAKNNEGMPAIYAIAEVLREWLADNNQPGLDDASMHAQMIRKQKDQAKQKEVRFMIGIDIIHYMMCLSLLV